MSNQSTVLEFVLLCFPDLHQDFYIPVSITMFLVYCVSLVANSIVIILISHRRQLHQPMYIIIRNLSFSDLLFDTITLPKIIAKYWFNAGSISYYPCVFQMFFVHYLGSIDSLVLMLMAIDRYVAICTPLRYHSIITNKLVTIICYCFWMFNGTRVSVISALAAKLHYCGPNKIKNCFCSLTFLIPLACEDQTFLKTLSYIFAMVVLLLPLSIILLSYILIIIVVHSAAGSENWQKAFYTCMTHLFVIGLYYVPRVFVYSISQIAFMVDANVNVLILCLYTYIPHVASPIIYCLRTKEIRSVLISQKIFDSKTNHKVSAVQLSS
ncbi:olfactory receptor 1496 [Xenopus laevis]|uniref:Olfactory receptor n=1 Tax=Xenopus laevis TaxID=8355 RepID=A0A8J0UQK4_XENLA|nr:olfactory receptor 1496 [Xenopus laevis]